MKTKKYLKIASLAVVAAIFIWTFVFLYRKSQPTVKAVSYTHLTLPTT